ncbi:MAG: PD-(D/E)XK nuclease family protein [Synergistaceae bacterium]|nr:PD-(D/E)XK nuclease family protein [Synergistaceae bacterium]
MVRTFKQCPRRYELEYVHMLIPCQAPEALALGSAYHEKVEAILKGQLWRNDGVTGAMAEAFDRMSSWREWDVKGVEEEFRVHMAKGLYLKGKMDVVLADGTPVEHKTFGGSDWDRYVDHLRWDDQASLYLLALNERRMKYVVCRKPTIRQRQGETEEEYVERCREWLAENDAVRTFEVTRARGELEDTLHGLKALAKTIRAGNFYRNPQACAIVPCPYASICLSFDPEISYMVVMSMVKGFEKKERRNEELCKF